MAATKKTPTKESAEPKTPVDVAEQEKKTAPSAEPSGDTPAGYLWVTRRRRGVMLGERNAAWDAPSLIDAKSLPELEVQGYVVVDGPDGVPDAK
jgi:hypothetical protein